MARGDLSMVACASCGFVYNQRFQADKVPYDEDYDNNQTCSPLFHSYVDGLVVHLVDEIVIRGKTIVEIGCGKGYFLRALIERNDTNRGIGFDPTYLGPSDALDGRLHFERSFYDDSRRDLAPDIVICRHVIEHIGDPLQMLRSVRSALTHASDARVFFETPSVEWILQNNVVWDFFYEHCSLFSVASLTYLFERAGFAVDSVERTFGHQYLWIEARPDTARPPQANGGFIAELARQFARSEEGLLQNLSHRVAALKKEGRLAIWGAGAKGVTLAHLIDGDRALIDCLIDLNPRKQGRFVAGTGHPIVSFQNAYDRGVRSAIVMNPNYLDENRALLAEAGISIRLHCD